MAKPNLFILGAPKCGTTALAQWLAAHPAIFVSPSKEPHHFSEDHCLTPDRGAYERLFDGAEARHAWRCEASVWSLFSDTAVGNIEAYSPGARYIVMVRDPVTMVPSMHEHHRFNGAERVADLAEALALNDRRRAGEPAGVRPGYRPTSHLAYLHSCALGWQVERLLQRVDRERVHFIRYEALADDPRAALDGVFAFLGVAPAYPPRFDRVNTAKTRRSFLLDALVLRAAEWKRRLGIHGRLRILSRVRRLNRRGIEREPLPSALRERLASAFAADGEVLSNAIGQARRKDG